MRFSLRLTFPTRLALALAAVVAVVPVGCGGGAKVGEPCTTSGATVECVTGAVCTSNGAESPRCLTSCTDSSQCAAGEDCNGVEGSSLKACRPKDSKKGK